MIAADKRQAVYLLHQDGMSLREIAHRLHLSRNTVRAILKQKGEMPLGPHQDGIRIEEDLLRRLYADCKGWMERMHEKLVEEEGLDVSYSTFTPPCAAACTSWAWVKVASSNAVTACPMWLGQKCNTTPAPIGSSWAPPPRC